MFKIKSVLTLIIFSLLMLSASYFNGQFSPYVCSSNTINPPSATIGDTITIDLSTCCSDFYNQPTIEMVVHDSVWYNGIKYGPGSIPFIDNNPIQKYVLISDESVSGIAFFKAILASSPVICGASTGGGYSPDMIITFLTCSPPTPTGSGGSSSVCGTNSFTFPIRTCASGALRWYENSSGTGTFYTTASVNPTSTTTYYPFCYTTCLSSAGNAVTATYTCPTSGSGSAWTWTGCQSIDWFNDCNWDRGSIPTITSNVIIPNTLNNPLISGTTANCLDITIQSGTGAILNINTTGGGALNVVLP